MDNMMDSPMASMMGISEECKKQIKKIQEKGKKVYDHMMKEECGKLCKDAPVKASALWPHEPKIVPLMKAVFDYFRKDTPLAMDIDKICPNQVVEKHIYPIYEDIKAKCIKKPGEFDNHKNLCEAKKDDFPKTKKCMEDEMTKIFQEKAKPLPEVMDCAKKALDTYCTEPYLKKQTEYFMNFCRKNYDKCFRGQNPWQLKEEFFKGKCTGKLVPAG